MCVLAYIRLINPLFEECLEPLFMACSDESLTLWAQFLKQPKILFGSIFAAINIECYTRVATSELVERFNSRISPANTAWQYCLLEPNMCHVDCIHYGTISVLFSIPFVYFVVIIIL